MCLVRLQTDKVQHLEQKRAKTSLLRLKVSESWCCCQVYVESSFTLFNSVTIACWEGVAHVLLLLTKCDSSRRKLFPVISRPLLQAVLFQPSSNSIKPMLSISKPRNILKASTNLHVAYNLHFVKLNNIKFLQSSLIRLVSQEQNHVSSLSLGP